MKRIVLMVVVLLGVCAYFLPQVHKGGKRSPAATTFRPARTTTNANPITSASAATTPKCCSFAPDSPLPKPAAVSSGPEEERAILLAQQVLAGGGGTLPALVAALQQAGFPIRDSTGKVIVQPVGKSQGIVFELWEVNALAELIANRRQVTVPLNNFAEVMASTLPELRGAPMTDLLLEGVRDHARDKDGSMLFWAVFIAELGRQNQVHKPYDLLFDIDPAKTQLDVLQITLICKRMAADLAVLAHPDKAGRKQAFHFPLPTWPAAKVYAAESPCKFDNVVTEIMDWFAAGTGLGFDQLMGYLVDQGLSGAETVSKVVGLANIFSAYAKLAAALAAFDMKIEMKGGTPLVRTQKQWPETGERKTLVATLKMDMGKFQWANCFRPMLNVMGVDLDVENNGPIKGAMVSWGESEFGGELVQFVSDARHFQDQGGGTTSPILDTRTDEAGKATVEVEGIGQRQDLGDAPQPVMKKAKAVATAVLKPANIYTDTKDAISTFLGGLGALWAMPAELMYRTNFSFGAWYNVPVKDWTPGFAAWTGSVTDTMVKRQTIKKTVNSKCCGGLPITSTQSDLTLEKVEQQWEIGSDTNAKALTPDIATAKASYSMSASVTSNIMFKRTGWNSCKSGPEATWSTHTIAAAASAGLKGKTEVRVNIGADGSYSIATDRPAEIPQGKRKTTRVLAYGPNCGASAPGESLQGTGSYSPSLAGPMIQGEIDPDNKDELIGSQVVVEKDSRVGITITHTYTWNLTRKR